jgi:hypothetical protein
VSGTKIPRRNNVDNKLQNKEHICLKEETNVTVKRICILHFVQPGYMVAKWLRHCASNRKVAGSIPDGVIGIFHWHNPSGPEVETASNRNDYQEYFLGVKTACAYGLQPCHLHVPIVLKNLGASTSWNPQDLSMPVMGLLYLYLYFVKQCGGRRS